METLYVMNYDQFHIFLSEFVDEIIYAMDEFIKVSRREFYSQTISSRRWKIRTDGDKTLFIHQGVEYKILRGYSF